MAFKFFGLGKANAEITRLETELSTAQAKIAQLESATADVSAEVVAEAERIQKELTAAQASVSALNTEKAQLASRVTVLETEATTFKAKEAAMETTIEQRASAKARDIVAAQGAAPVSGKTDSTPGAPPKADTSKLSGKALMAAAFNAQFETK
jgi:predicted  nucleic acid-binding Zn-ribbon protein